MITGGPEASHATELIKSQLDIPDQGSYTAPLFQLQEGQFPQQLERQNILNKILVYETFTISQLLLKNLPISSPCSMRKAIRD